MRSWLALFIVAAIAASIAGEVLAHDAAAWIMEDPATAWCCGRGDCEEAPAGAVLESVEGWRIKATGQLFPRARVGTQWSEGSRLFGLYEAKRPGTWWCQPAHYAPLRRCLFIQPGGV